MHTKRIFLAGFSLESNTYTPNKTQTTDFSILRGNEIIEELECAKYLLNKGYTLVPSVLATAEPNGVITFGAYQSIVNEILDSLPNDESIDGVLLILHGAMQVEFINSGEAFLVSQIREIVGASVPVSIVLDMHANVSLTLSRLSNIIVGYRTAPHVDIEQCYMTAAKLLDRALTEGVLPWTMSIKIPMTLPGEFAVTDYYPAKYVVEQLCEMDKLDNVWCSSYFTGMTWSDCSHGRSTIVVSGCGENRDSICQAMRNLAEKIWDARYDFKMGMEGLDPEEAVETAIKDSSKLVFISDSGDNTTAGGSGDNAFMLKTLLDKGAKNTLVAGIMDSAAVSACANAGIDSVIKLSIGGEADLNSTRIVVDNVRVRAIHYNLEGNADSVLVSIEGVDVIINSKRICFTSVEVLEEYGADYRNYHIIVVKLGYLFPELSKVKGRSIIALTKGTTMLDVRYINYKKLKRPLYPLEDGFIYSTENAIY